MLLEGKSIKRFVVGPGKLGLRTQELCQVGIIVFTPGSTPLQKKIKKWTTDTLIANADLSAGNEHISDSF
jgi:hypothetical protein